MKLEEQKYLIMTLDPVQVGTGGYRLGRVDNAIVREPGTRLPKIPGTSLHGAIRSAAAMRCGKPESGGQNPKGTPEDNPVVYTFGAGEDGGFSSGVVSIHDARILLFPVASQDGPVWITTASILREARFTGGKAPSHLESIRFAGDFRELDGSFSLGWLMLDVESEKVSLKAPSDSNWHSRPELTEALSRTVIVHENLFAELINSGLEVRTSVAINPETGAAEEGALFTYEAIPRATFLVFETVIDDYRQNKFPVLKNSEWKPETPGDVVKGGLELLQYTGIGGMGTRGFGRLEVIGQPICFTPNSSEQTGGAA